MTDIMKLATDYAQACYHLANPESYDAERAEEARAALQEAIEALQSECAEHKENAVRNARQAVAFRAERDALRAQLEALQRQEPLCYVRNGEINRWNGLGGIGFSGPVYASPKALEPLTDEQIEQAVKTYGVSWTGYREDEHGFYTIPVLSPYHYQLARAIEAAHGIRSQR